MKEAVRIYRTLPRFDCRKPSAVTIGNFDGVHLGHQAILGRLRERAIQHDLYSTVMTFQPHPRTYFALLGQRPEFIPTQVSSLRDKIGALQRHGVRQIVLQRFNRDLAEMEPEDFIGRFLVDGLNTRWLLVGEDFRYGRKRRGDIAMLRDSGRRYGFHVDTLDDVLDLQGSRISSSEVRAALAVGDLPRAQGLLGRPYALSGHVVHGRKIGRDLGFPTMNLNVPAHCALRSGIYVVAVHGLDDAPLPGVASLGVRPTVSDEGRLLLEVHVLDRSIDAYGKLARVEFLAFLRDEEKFPDFTTMTAAIRNDVQAARDHFDSHGL